MSPFLEHLEQGLARCELRGVRLLVGVSGGADSVSLLRGLLNLRESCSLTVTAAHMNHRLRGDASVADSAWVETLCRQLDVPVRVVELDVAAEAAANGIGIEEAARGARYRWLEQVAEETGCTHIAVAHTADDQAETILHHVLRGTGVAGLHGMKWHRHLPGGVILVRPLLDISRSAVIEFLRDLGQTFRDDTSNLDATFTRNRIRLDLLPRLRTEFNPQIDDALRRLGRQAAELHQLVEVIARDLLHLAVRHRDPHEVRLDVATLRDQPRPVVRELFVQLWRQQDWPRQKMGFDHWDHLADVAEHGRATHLPGGGEARRQRGELVIRFESR
ncbi:MAG: tRNA lysidine(34) synthetase TilS [Planctomycetales bacterium]|nr:tRNA lysidine(34) synthetase TilS [Planctomycetales bacterium]